MFIGIAYAMGGGGGAPGGQSGGGFTAFLPLVLMFVIFYFLLIRPQQKRAKDHRAMLQNLKKGDYVVTSGGLHGRIVGITDKVLTLEIGDDQKIKVKVSRAYISGMAIDEAKAA
jgi:preprotein translocase subunit YajC